MLRMAWMRIGVGCATRGRLTEKPKNDLMPLPVRRRCLTPENMQLARQTAKDQLRHFFLSLGFANVVFEGEEEELQPPASR